MEFHCKYDQLVSVNDLKAYPKNRNEHSPQQIERLAKLIEYQGLRAPIIVAKPQNYIAKGHGTLEALKKLGATKVPVVYQEFESDEQLYLFVQSDNAIAAWSELDLSAINIDIGDLGPFDVDLLGIEGFEVEVADKLGLTDDDAIPAQIETRTKPGDVWILGDHRLLCGDSTKEDDVSRLMNGDRANLVFTDPPYGVSYVGKTKDALTIDNDALNEDEFLSFLGKAFAEWPIDPGVSYYVFSPPGNLEGLFRRALSSSLRQSMVWVKQQFVMGRQDYHWRHESILYGWKEGAAHYFIDDRTQDTVWQFDRPKRSTDHPTMKPVELIEKAIRNSSKQNQIVFDGFSGSGSTIIACEKLHRRGFGIELDPHYCDVILKRWEEFTGKSALLEE